MSGSETSHRAPDASIVVVTFNSEFHVAACLDSVKESPGELVETIVVDNASTDGTIETLGRYRELHLIRNSSNQGFAKACNQGTAVARGQYLLFLNPDARLKPGALTELLNFARNSSAPGLYGGRTESNDGALDPRCCWRFPSIWSAFCFATGLSILFRRSRRLNPETIQPRELRVSGPVEALSGSFMLATRDVWQSLGGFDERFFMYGEDIDICMKAKSLGFHRTFVESASAEHAVGASSHADADKMVLVLRGKVTFARKHWPHMRATVYIVFLGIGVWVRACGERILRPLNLTHSSKWRSVFRARDLWRPGYPTRDRT